MHPSIQTDQETKKRQQTNRKTTDKKQSQEQLDKQTLGQAEERREEKVCRETSLVEDKSHLKKSTTFLQHKSLKVCNPKKKQTESKQKSVKSS